MVKPITIASDPLKLIDGANVINQSRQFAASMELIKLKRKTQAQKRLG